MQAKNVSFHYCKTFVWTCLEKWFRMGLRVKIRFSLKAYKIQAFPEPDFNRNVDCTRSMVKEFWYSVKFPSLMHENPLKRIYAGFTWMYVCVPEQLHLSENTQHLRVEQIHTAGVAKPTRSFGSSRIPTGSHMTPCCSHKKNWQPVKQGRSCSFVFLL